MGLHWTLLPELTRRKDGRERSWRENRTVLNGILWVLRTGVACVRPRSCARRAALLDVRSTPRRSVMPPSLRVAG